MNIESKNRVLKSIQEIRHHRSDSDPMVYAKKKGSELTVPKKSRQASITSYTVFKDKSDLGNEQITSTPDKNNKVSLPVMY